MAKFDVVVAGAGNAGLAAAVQLALMGKKTLLIEQHNLPGGCATSFKRGRFEFEPSVHEICDYGPADNKGGTRMLFEELGVKVDWITVDDCYRCISTYSDGTPMDITMPAGRQPFIDKMEEYVPGSRPSMEKFFALADEVAEGVAYLSSGKGSDSKYLQQHYPNMLRTAAYPVNDVLKKALKMPQKAIDILAVYWCYLGVDLDNMQFLHYGNMVNMYVTRKAVIPSHTSHEASMAFMKRFYELGGTAWFNCRAKEFLFDGDRICGVRTTMGDVECDYVLANINPDIIYGSMMPKNLVPEREKKLSAARNKNYSARMFTAYFALDTTAEKLGIHDYSVFFPGTTDSVKEAASLRHVSTNQFSILVCYNVAKPDFSPPGTCVVSFTTMFGPDDWNNLKARDYVKFKNDIAKSCIETMKKKMGIDITPYIEEMEVATPWTFARYLGTPEGSTYGFETAGWDSMFPRMMMLSEDFPVKGLRHIGAASSRGDGYNSAWIVGQMMAKLAVKDMKEEGGRK